MSDPTKIVLFVVLATLVVALGLATAVLTA